MPKQRKQHVLHAYVTPNAARSTTLAHRTGFEEISHTISSLKSKTALDNGARSLWRRMQIFHVRCAYSPVESSASIGITRARVINIPLPTHRLASTALQALQVDSELSPLVRRQLSLVTPDTQTVSNGINGHSSNHDAATVLHTEYQATTNRMLRVAVNGFFESLGVVLQVMEELDVDVLATKRPAS